MSQNKTFYLNILYLDCKSDIDCCSTLAGCKGNRTSGGNCCIKLGNKIIQYKIVSHNVYPKLILINLM